VLQMRVLPAFSIESALWDEAALGRWMIVTNL
jgi:hypothetical protein